MTVWDPIANIDVPGWQGVAIIVLLFLIFLKMRDLVFAVRELRMRNNENGGSGHEDGKEGMGGV